MVFDVHQAFARGVHRLSHFLHVLRELVLVPQKLQWYDINDGRGWQFLSEKRRAL